jgi:hypothetical protein
MQSLESGTCSTEIDGLEEKNEQIRQRTTAAAAGCVVDFDMADRNLFGMGVRVKNVREK